MHARERAATVLARVDSLIASGKEVIDPPARGLGLIDRPGQLIRLAQAGVRIPETLITDVAETAAEFAATRPGLLVKPATGSAPARAFQESHLDFLAKAPVILQ